jgi:hypothetical protein
MPLRCPTPLEAGAGYYCSWLVDSSHGWLRRLGADFNRTRKAWCAALQWAHAACVGCGGAALAITAAEGEEGAWGLGDELEGLLEPLAVGWPLAVTLVANVALLGAVELGRRLTRKARALGLDARGPGKAHPAMVAGAQEAAKGYTWAGLLLANLALPLGLDMGRWTCLALAALLAVAGAAGATVADDAAGTAAMRAARSSPTPPPAAGPSCPSTPAMGAERGSGGLPGASLASP